ncbi:MAG: hypothetical protein H7175_03080 [Burkholderiales bacterium]|nr:hypothetical protein [Anaerolineae bacterium]
MKDARLMIVLLLALVGVLWLQLDLGRGATAADVALQVTPSGPQASVTALLATVYAGQTLVATTPTVGFTPTPEPLTDSDRLEAAFAEIEGIAQINLASVML